MTSKGCVGFLNEVSSKYNIVLRKMLSDLRAELPDFNVIYNNIYDPLADAINNPTKYGAFSKALPKYLRFYITQEYRVNW